MKNIDHSVFLFKKLKYRGEHGFKRWVSRSFGFERFLYDSQWWDEARMTEYQGAKLKSIIMRAYKEIPYYQKNWHNQGDLNDITSLPFLEKTSVRDNFKSLVNFDIKLKYTCHTSGSSGTPLALSRDARNIGFEYALLNRQRQWAGIDKSSKGAIFLGQLLSPGKIDKNCFWEKQPGNKVFYSSYHLSFRNAQYYLEALKKNSPDYLEGYPSSLFILARYMAEKNQTFPVKAVLTTSETLLPSVKELLEKVFCCQVFDYYGQAERVAAIHTCEKGTYHVVPEYSFVEFLSQPFLNEDCYELVGTSFTNFAMPLVRYKTGDIVKKTEKICTCGRAFPVIDEIYGRMDDFVITPSGKVIGRLDHVLKNVHHVEQGQIYQPSIGKLLIKIMPTKDFSKSDEIDILQNMQKRIPEPMNISVERVDNFYRGGRGKFKFVVSDVMNEFLNGDKNEN